jgi:hypothetical protein
VPDVRQGEGTETSFISRIALLLAAVCALTVSLTLGSACGTDPYVGTWMMAKEPRDVTVIERGAGDSYIVHFTSVGNTATFVPDGDKLSTARSAGIQAVDGKLKYWVRDLPDHPAWMVRKGVTP